VIKQEDIKYIAYVILDKHNINVVNPLGEG